MICNALYLQKFNPKSLLSLLPNDIFKIVKRYVIKHQRIENLKNWFRETNIDKHYLKQILWNERNENIRFPINPILDIADKNWRKSNRFGCFRFYTGLEIDWSDSVLFDRYIPMFNIPKKIVVANDCRIPNYKNNWWSSRYHLIKPGQYWIWEYGCDELSDIGLENIYFYILYQNRLEKNPIILTTKEVPPDQKDFQFYDHWYNKYKKLI